MPRQPELYHWTDTLATRFPHLSRPTVAVLALWTLGMILTRHATLTTVAIFLAQWLHQRPNSLRQRLREFYQEAAAKSGTQRRDFDVTTCFAPLLSWLLSLWSCPRLVLALDATNLGARWHILCLSVVCRGIGIPVAWKIVPGNQKGAWNPHWCDLLQALRPVIPTPWRVLVLSDRGLESAEIFGAIVACGWHPLMRVKAAGKFRPVGWFHWYGFAQFAPRLGTRCALCGQAYKTAATPLNCTLLACWTAGHTEPWLLVSDLAPTAANPCWYAFRAWIEQGFKVLKSGGLQWQTTRMTAPERAERLWLALAVTTLWLVAIGAEVESREALETVQELPGVAASQPPRTRKGRRKRRVFAVGLAVVLARLLNREPLPQGMFPPEPWPEGEHEIPTLTEQELSSNQTYP